MKLAIEILSKVFRSLDEADSIRSIVAGLLLRVKSFTNYKMIMKDVQPFFVSINLMDKHHEAMRNQCPNLF
jgi:hypothetical protein